MSVVYNDAKSAVSNSVEQLSKRATAVSAQIKKIESISADIRNIMRGARSSQCDRVVSSLSNSIDKSKKAAENIDTAISDLKNWISVR